MTKEEREEARRASGEHMAGNEACPLGTMADQCTCAAQFLPSALDTIDELERQRDALREAMTTRLAAIELRPGDALVFKIEGLAMACSRERADEVMQRVIRVCRATLEAAGLAGIKPLAVDKNVDLAVVRIDPAAVVDLEARVAELERAAEDRLSYEQEQRERR